jgi:hypothetical protein
VANVIISVDDSRPSPDRVIRADTLAPAGGQAGNDSVTEDEMRKRLEALRIEHRDLDAAIDALTGSGSSDQLQIARLKKRKLKLKDQIALIEDHLIPDIIA